MFKKKYTLTFKNDMWVCFDDNVKIEADSLDELDLKLESYLNTIFKNVVVEVFMYFDFQSFPSWHSQYMPHYFNRILQFKV